VWAILEAELQLEQAASMIRDGRAAYPVKLPFVIAQTEKGFGFPGAGTNRAHNLPLEGSPRVDEAARTSFNDAAKRLFVSKSDLAAAQVVFAVHDAQGREKERDNPLATRRPEPPVLPPAPSIAVGGVFSPMVAMDAWVVALAKANPRLRFRVGNPDELKSNQMGGVLNALKHRVNRPESQGPESVHGSVITALNEEAAIGAALGNKGGLNLAVTYEAFAMKMLGALRQDIVFARQQIEAERPPRWIGIPLIATSHTWENGKNQQSHQDPTIGEALLGEMSDVSRVFFPIDAATAVECLRRVYADRGVIACVVAPKRPLPTTFDAASAAAALHHGAADVEREDDPQLQFVTVGAYQLVQAQRAAARLRERGWRVRTTCIIEPGRLRTARDEFEARVTLSDESLRSLFPAGVPRVLVSHTRPEMMIGVMRRIDEGPSRLRAHGYLSRGGTLDAMGMLYANRCTWAHLVASAASLLGVAAFDLLTSSEEAAVLGRGAPLALW
jgi:phosphoketolase